MGCRGVAASSTAPGGGALVLSLLQEKLEDEHLCGGTINRVTVALRLILKAGYRKKLMLPLYKGT